MNNTIFVNIGLPDEGAHQILNSFTLPVMEFGRTSGLLTPLEENLHINMKTVKYSPYEKVVELIASIVAGCEHTVTINSRRVPDTALAMEVIYKDRFADQSGANRLLNALTDENVAELERAFSAYYPLHGSAGRAVKGELMVDLDATGFVANGRKYEGASKGHLGNCGGSHGGRGYRASFAHSNGEMTACVFDSCGATESHHLDALLKMVRLRIGSPKVRGIVIRGGAAYGTATIVDKLIDLGFLFLLKGNQPSSARKSARRIRSWTMVGDYSYGELRARVNGSRHRVRVVVTGGPASAFTSSPPYPTYSTRRTGC